MNSHILPTGTPVTEPAPQCLRAGALQADFGAEGLRWNGVEMLRAVQFLLRTSGRGIPAPAIAGLDVQQDDVGFSVRYRAHFGVSGAGVAVDFALAGGASGTLTASVMIRADVPFDTNRTGFVILLPLDGFAGTEVLVDRASVPSR